MFLWNGMLPVVGWIVLAPAAAQTGRSPVIIQRTSGWCSPAIVNVGGPITFVCNGVSPRAP